MAEFVVIGQNIVNAMTNEELENQSNSTNVSNVYFDAYFKDGENTTHSKESDLDEEETLIVNINVKNTGSIENGKIKIYDMKPNLNYEAFKNLKNYELFKKVHPVGETIEWETGEDVNPEDLYYNSIEVK